MFTPTWGNDPIWLIFFKWVETTNQLFSWIVHEWYLDSLPSKSSKYIQVKYHWSYGGLEGKKPWNFEAHHSQGMYPFIFHVHFRPNQTPHKKKILAKRQQLLPASAETSWCNGVTTATWIHIRRDLNWATPLKFDIDTQKASRMWYLFWKPTIYQCVSHVLFRGHDHPSKT